MTDCVVIKLVNGDLLIAERVHEDDHSVVVNKPIAIRLVQVQSPEGLIEKTVTAPFCSLSADTEFVLDRRHVMFVANLHASVVPMYFKMTESFEDEFNIDDSNLDLQDDYHDDELHEEPIMIVPDTKTIH